MSFDQKIVDRLQQLIEQGESIKPLQRRNSPGSVSFRTPVAAEVASQWGTSCLSILRRVFGQDSDYYITFNVLYPGIDEWFKLTKARGILKAAKDDYEKGYLFEIRTLIQAEVFDDLLEQAEYLLLNGYHEPAAVVAGAVLEDGMRQLCVRNSIALPPKPKLDTMNADLAKAGVYNLLTQKKITALADLRNKAAHGKWSEFTEQDVKEMLPQVRSFMESHFS